MASEIHRDLAAFIKSVHKTLRLQSRAVGVDDAWYQHCQHTHVLEEYAEKMQLLATEFWEKKNHENSCRIQWVVKQCVGYFHTGGLEKAAAQESKMSLKYFAKPIKQIQSPMETVSVLKLLDVGSCYNPFFKFSLFDVTALDLMPATKDVIKCDFLSVNISTDTELIQSPCLVLPEKYFDVVVFSLLLEYLPSSNQRLICCKNAYKLLKTDGLLFILTPDSKHATANSKVMKSWRSALASLGFWRVGYQKLKHLHCMSYRKCVDIEVPRHWHCMQHSEELPQDLMYIPQDFIEYCDNFSDDDEPVTKRCDIDNKLLADSFSDLPESDVFL